MENQSAASNLKIIVVEVLGMNNEVFNFNKDRLHRQEKNTKKTNAWSFKTN